MFRFHSGLNRIISEFELVSSLFSSLFIVSPSKLKDNIAFHLSVGFNVIWLSLYFAFEQPKANNPPSFILLSISSQVIRNTAHANGGGKLPSFILNPQT